MPRVSWPGRTSGGAGCTGGADRRRPTPRLGPGPVLTVAGAGASAVLILCWDTSPLTANAGGVLTNAGRAFGLLAGYGVVVQMLLMARLPLLERGIGADRLARWHATSGPPSAVGRMTAPQLTRTRCRPRGSRTSSQDCTGTTSTYAGRPG